ncbi:MAG: hypothetical protein LBS58_02795 [Coriobacteriales bacterium]|nr:hypothetical protein [Coriobacteriales bacterium]
MKQTCSWMLALVLAATLVTVPGGQSPYAFAETQDIDADPDELQQRVELSAADYNAAIKKLAALETQVAEIQRQLRELERVLPAQKQKSDDATVEYYRMQRSSNLLLNLVFGSQSFSDFLANIEYISRLQESYCTEIARLSALRQQLEDVRAVLAQRVQEAADEKLCAEKALAEAQEARAEAQRQAELRRQQEAEAAAQAQAQAQAAAEAAAAVAAQEAASAGEPEPTPGVPSGPVGGDDADWSLDRQGFVDQWAPRIDAYLAGSPLAGQGTAFAQASWDYGVDPRWSPAISFTESSVGRNCFLPYNAWGWGSVSWPDWETAIDAHVRGLARGYGYTISLEAAKKYCPPNWEHWYNTTLAQMGNI